MAKDKYSSMACYIKFGVKISSQVKTDTLPDQFQKFFTQGEGANYIDAIDGGVMAKSWTKALVPNDSNTEIDNQDVQDFADFAVYCNNIGEPIQTISVEDVVKQREVQWR